MPSANFRGTIVKTRSHGDVGTHTRAQLASAQAMLDAGRPLGEVASALRRLDGHKLSVAEVETLIRRGELRKPVPGYVPVKRECLRCQAPFKAETRFQRMCAYCRKNA